MAAIVPEGVRLSPESDGMEIDDSVVSWRILIMMNTVVGSAIGGLVAGAVALGAAAAMKPSAAPAYGPDPNGGYAMTVANTAALNNAALNNGASMQCQPYEEAVLRRAIVAGREVTDVTCITRNAS